MNYPQHHQHYDYRAYEQQRYAAHVQRIELNKNYVWPLGILRGFIIVSCLGGLISACIIPTDYSAFYGLDPTYQQTRAALIAFFAGSFAVSSVIFAVSLSNFVNLPGVQSVWWLISFCILDLCFFLAFAVLGIVAAVRETNVQSMTSPPVLIGTYAASSFFALFSAVLMAASIGVSIPYILRLKEIE